MKIKKGDTIQIISGKDKGKTGKVMQINSSVGTVLLEGLNLFKKHKRPKKQGEKGEIVTVPRPLRVSKIMLVCSGCGKPTRAGHRFDGEIKVRFCKKCEAPL